MSSLEYKFAGEGGEERPVVSELPPTESITVWANDVCNLSARLLHMLSLHHDVVGEFGEVAQASQTGHTDQVR
jgi:hypothetical protein